MSSKKVVDSKTKKSIQTSTETDGTVVETTTIKVTETYEDGTTAVTTEVKTRKTKPAGQGAGGGITQCPSAVRPEKATASKVPNTTPQQFIVEALERSNTLRAKHNSPPLKLNDELGKIAQAWANQLANIIGTMKHSTCGFGENVYWSTDPISGKRPVDQWYSEIKDYDFSKPVGQPGTGHFTQLIWKGTTDMGIAMAKGKNGYFVVANYYPPGNFIGKYPENIEPATSRSKSRV